MNILSNIYFLNLVSCQRIKLFLNFEAMKWQFCLICLAKEKPQPLKCPLDSLEDGAGVEAYRSFLDCNVVEFRKIGSLPVELKLKGISV